LTADIEDGSHGDVDEDGDGEDGGDGEEDQQLKL